MRKYQDGAEDKLRARSDVARALNVAGSAVASAGDIEAGARLQREALDMGAAIAKERPNDVENLREMGVVYLFLSGVEFAGDAPSLGNRKAAEEARSEYYRLFRRLAEADSRNASAQHDYGLCLREMAGSTDDLRHAEVYAREGVRVMEGRPPGSPAYERHIGLLWAVLGGVLEQQGRTAEARAALERGAHGFAKENPKDGLARGDFLALWRLQGDYEKVWATLSPPIEGAREDIYLAYDLAHVALKTGRRDQVAAIWAPWMGKYPKSDRALGL